jgi:hypothetical protein
VGADCHSLSEKQQQDLSSTATQTSIQSVPNELEKRAVQYRPITNLYLNNPESAAAPRHISHSVDSAEFGNPSAINDLNCLNHNQFQTPAQIAF